MSTTAVMSNEESFYPTFDHLQTFQPPSTSYFQLATGMEAIVPYDSGMSSDSFTEPVPFLKITVQPNDRFRFRYKSESGSHGKLRGAGKGRSKANFPTVKLYNYDSSNKIEVKASLYTNEDFPRRHILELVGKNCSGGSCTETLSEDNTAVFRYLEIESKKKEELFKIISQNKSDRGEEFDEEEIKKEVMNEIKALNMNAARLCFEAFCNDEPICPKVFTGPITNLKSASSDLKITRLSLAAGRCSGGEEMILLCDKINRDDIKIRFYEKNDNEIVLWEDFGVFNKCDVHHQVAIAFKTPPYNQNTEKMVYIELYRPSDGQCGEAVKFTYIPDEIDALRFSKKRKLQSSDISMQLQDAMQPSTSSQFMSSPSNVSSGTEEDVYLQGSPSTSSSYEHILTPNSTGDLSDDGTDLLSMLKELIDGDNFGTHLFQGIENLSTNPEPAFKDEEMLYPCEMDSATEFCGRTTNLNNAQGSSAALQTKKLSDMRSRSPFSCAVGQMAVPAENNNTTNFQGTLPEAQMMEIPDIKGKYPFSLKEIIKGEMAEFVKTTDSTKRQGDSKDMRSRYPFSCAVGQMAVPAENNNTTNFQGTLPEAQMMEIPDIKGKYPFSLKEIIKGEMAEFVKTTDSTKRQGDSKDMRSRYPFSCAVGQMAVPAENNNTTNFQGTLPEAQMMEIPDIKGKYPFSLKEIIKGEMAEFVKTTDSTKRQGDSKDMRSRYPFSCAVGQMAVPAENNNTTNFQGTLPEAQMMEIPDIKGKYPFSLKEIIKGEMAEFVKTTDSTKRQGDSKDMRSRYPFSCAVGQMAVPAENNNTTNFQGTLPEAQMMEIPDIKGKYPFSQKEIIRGEMAEFVKTADSTKRQGDLKDRKKVDVLSKKSIQNFELFKKGISEILKNRKMDTYLLYVARLMSVEDENGNLLLHLAVQEQSENTDLIAKILSIAPQNVDKQNKFKETCLHLATMNDSYKLVFLLMTTKGNPSIKNQNGDNCFHLAAKSNFATSMKILLSPKLKHGIHIPSLDDLNYDGLSPLHLCIMNNAKECMQLLLRAGANVNIPEGKTGCSPLHLAIDQQPSLVGYLLSHPGIDTECTDYRGYTPYEAACEARGNDVVHYELLKVAQLSKDNEAKIIESFLSSESMKPKKIAAETEDYESSSSERSSDSDGEDDDYLPATDINHQDKVENIQYHNMNVPKSDEENESVYNVPTNNSQTKGLKMFYTVQISHQDFQQNNLKSKGVQEKSNAIDEDKLCKILDADNGWRKLGRFIGLGESTLNGLEVLSKQSSPAKVILKKVKRLYPDYDEKTLKNILKEAELKETVHILESLNI